MRLRWLFLLIPCAAALAQISAPADKPPQDVDDALRERIMIFYNAHVSGKYHEALKVVADESQDDFLAAARESYKSCEITRIDYTDNFSKADVLMACKGEYRWHGSHMPVTIPVTSTWKVLDGKWYWYYIKQTKVMTPWGLSQATPDNSTGESKMPVIPPDPAALARDILSKVTIDKRDVALRGYELSSGEVHVTNQMPGPITVSVDRLPIAGTSIKISPAEVPAGGKATIVFSYDPNDPSIACNVCSTKAALPTLTANVRISPTAQVFPVKVTFAVSPEVLKQLPKFPGKP